MALYTIKYIAKYEMRTLLRSWFFRIFAGLSVFGLGIFNIALNVEASEAPWIYRAIGASVPYANLIILNLAQAIVAVFLASEFLKHDRKNDTVEVIYARSMTNGEYILGKTLGILLVFFVLNFIVLAEGIGFSFLSGDTARSFWPLLVYPVLISVPTLLYVFGLSFFLMLLLKNQAITFILMLGYIAVSVFYLNQKAYHVFDFIAYHVPMMHSSFGGFGSTSEILLHRGIYFFMGIAFIFFTVYRLDRLPQSRFFTRLPLVFVLVFTALAGLLVKNYITRKVDAQSFKREVIAINNRYCFYPRATVATYVIDLKHESNKISANAIMVMCNHEQADMDTLLFSLNPSLRLNKIYVNGKPAKFSREVHLIKLGLDKVLAPGDSVQVEINYEGSIDERICFIDLYNADEKDNITAEVFNIRKRFAWITNDFVCLTPSSLWYPVSGTGYATRRPIYYSPDFVTFKLKVATSSNLTAVSQGIGKNDGKGVFTFEPGYALPSISLLIANYRKYSLTTDSVTFNLYSREGNQYFEKYFGNVKDTLPYIVRELKQEYEKRSGLSYPFSNFSLVEVPVQFTLNNHIWAFASDAVQPEMVLFPEKGVLMWDTDFRHRRYREERNMKKNNEEVSPKELQARMFKQFVRRNLIWKPDDQMLFDHVVNWSTYNVFPCYFSFSKHLRSEKWPELTIAFESYMNDRTTSGGSKKHNFWEDLTTEEWIIMKLKQSSLEDLVKSSVQGDSSTVKPDELRKIVLSKGRQLFDIIESKYGKTKFDTAVSRLLNGREHLVISVTEMAEVFQNTLGLSLTDELNKWYSEKHLPGFIISGINTYKVIHNERTQYQVKLVVSNPEKADGCFIATIELKDPKGRQANFWEGDEVKADFSRKYFIPAMSAYELGFVFGTEPARMGIYTFISHNLPNTLIFDFPGFDQVQKVPVVDTISEIELITDYNNTDEIIVDNEDSGFSVIQANEEPFLKRLVHKNDKQNNNYTSIHFWNPPVQWIPTLRTDFYGKYIHSGAYTRGGQGERMVIWKTPLPDKGLYDVYFYYPKIIFSDRRGNQKDTYTFMVYNDDGKLPVDINTNDLSKGWNLLGTYYISADTAKIELTNKSAGRMVFADAVKWVRNE
jgi:ABC-type transport system involved in multi-copper enzyme maturation permease subunit